MNELVDTVIRENKETWTYDLLLIWSISNNTAKLGNYESYEKAVSGYFDFCLDEPTTHEFLWFPEEWRWRLVKKESKPGYHLTDIPKGKLGSPAKIQEEVSEFMDAVLQDAKVMQLLELADLVGAIELFLEKDFPGFTLKDLIKMKDVTKRAFENGHRN